MSNSEGGSDFEEPMDTNENSDGEFVEESPEEEFDEAEQETNDDDQNNDASFSDDDTFVRKRKVPFAKRQKRNEPAPHREQFGLRSRKQVNYTEEEFKEEPPQTPPVEGKRRSKRIPMPVAVSSEEELSDEEDYKEMKITEQIEEENLIEEPFQPVIEKILAHRPLDTGGNEYYVKWKGRSYLHVSWVKEEEFQKDRFLKSKLLRYHKKHELLYEDSEDIFNQSYLEVDRIIMHSEEENETLYLTKWQQLPYAEATWETAKDIGDDEKIREYHERSKRPLASSYRDKARPKPSKWVKYEQSPEYKDGNQLRPYQLEGLNWLTFCWYNNRNSILADEMGLGKTVQTVSVINHLFEDVKMRGPFLIVAPLITVPHWQREFDGWTNMNTIVYHGTSESREMIREYEFYYPEVKQKSKKRRKKKKQARGPPYKFNVLITTYEMVITDVAYLGNIKWKYLAVDEAHRLKNKNCKLINVLRTFHFDHLLLLTGTPLQNNTEELWTLLNLMDPEKFASLSEFSEKFGSLKETKQVEDLHTILRPYLLRRMKEDVEKSIAPKEETIVEVELTTIQKKYYRAIFEKNFSSLNMGSKASNVPSLLNVMMQLRKCCNHPYLLRGVEENILNARTTYGTSDENILMIKSSGKLVLIDKLLTKLKSQGHKVLIFSQMVRMLDILEDLLIYRKYAYERIDGSKRGNERQEAIDRFSVPDSDRFVFLLCTRAGGLGINLTAADTCIIYDSDWNPQNDIQAQARCHRIGQTQKVKIYRLLTHNTYEKKMFEKASLKLGLDQAVLTKMKSGSSTSSNIPLNTKEVDELLKYGAYGAFDDTPGTDQYDEEDIDKILERNSTTVVMGPSNAEGTPANNALSSFSKASFISSDANASVDVSDPDFWKKLMPDAPMVHPLVQEVPRKRKQVRRYGNVDTVELAALEARSDSDSEMEEYEETNDDPLDDGSLGWSTRDRNRLKTQLQVFGYGQWYTIRKAASLERRTVAEVQAYSEALISRFIHFLKEEPEEGLAYLRASFIPERYAPDAEPIPVWVDSKPKENENENDMGENGNSGRVDGEGDVLMGENDDVDTDTNDELSDGDDDPAPEEITVDTLDPPSFPAATEDIQTDDEEDEMNIIPEEDHPATPAPAPTPTPTPAPAPAPDPTPTPSPAPTAVQPSHVETDGEMKDVASEASAEKEDSNEQAGVVEPAKEPEGTDGETEAKVEEGEVKGEENGEAQEDQEKEKEKAGDGEKGENEVDEELDYTNEGTLRGYEFKEYAKRNAKLLVRRLESIAKASKHTMDCYELFGPNIPIPKDIAGDVCESWTEDDDRSLILGTFYHGYNRFAEMRLDPNLSFQRFHDPTDIPVNIQNDPRLAQSEPEETKDSLPSESEPTQPNHSESTIPTKEETPAIDEMVVSNSEASTDPQENPTPAKEEPLESKENSNISERPPKLPLNNQASNTLPPQQEIENSNPSNPAAAVTNIPADSSVEETTSTVNSNITEPAPASTSALGTSEEEKKVPEQAEEQTEEREKEITKSQEDVNNIDNEKELWPSEKVLNRRLRKVLRKIFIEANHKNASDDVRSRKRGEIQEEWSKREKMDFYKVITTHGIRTNPLDGQPDWNIFKVEAKLNRKTIPMISKYCASLMKQSNKAMELGKEYDVVRKEYLDALAESKAKSKSKSKSKGKKALAQNMEWLACGDGSLSFAQCKRVLGRVELFKNLREKILPMKNELPDALEDARLSATLPSWWVASVHDYALILGVIAHGFGQWEKICTDENLPFYPLGKEILSKMDDSEKPPAALEAALANSQNAMDPGNDSDSNKEDDDETMEVEVHSKKTKRKRGRQLEIYTNVLDFPKEKMLTKRLDYLVKYLTTPELRKPKKKLSKIPTPSKSTRPVRTPRAKMKKEQPLENPPVIMKYTDAARDEMGNVIFPIHVGKMRIEALGHVVYDRPDYHSSKYIWPVGFKSVRTYQSFINPEDRTEFTSEILDGGERPLFRVTAADAPDQFATAYSPTGAWTAVLKQGGEDTGRRSKNKKSKNSAVSGPEYFGLTRPIILKLIQDLPGSEKCEKYQPILFEEVEIQKRPSKKKRRLNGESPDSSPDPEDMASPPQRRMVTRQTTLNFGVTSASGDTVSLLNPS